MPSCVLKLAVTGKMLGAERLTVKIADRRRGVSLRHAARKDRESPAGAATSASASSPSSASARSSPATSSRTGTSTCSPRCWPRARRAGIVAILLGLPALRITGPFLAVSTLAFAVALDSYVLNPNVFAGLTPDIGERPVPVGPLPHGAGPRHLLRLPGHARADDRGGAGRAPVADGPGAHRHQGQRAGRGRGRGADHRGQAHRLRARRASSPGWPAACTCVVLHHAGSGTVPADAVVRGVLDGRHRRPGLDRRRPARRVRAAVARAGRERPGAPAGHRRRAAVHAAVPAGRPGPGRSSPCATSACAGSPTDGASSCPSLVADVRTEEVAPTRTTPRTRSTCWRPPSSTSPRRSTR